MSLNNSKIIKLQVLILVFAATSTPALAEEHCTLISSDITTFYFGVETPIPDPDHPITIDFFHTDIEVAFTGQSQSQTVSTLSR